MADDVAVPQTQTVEPLARRRLLAMGAAAVPGLVIANAGLVGAADAPPALEERLLPVADFPNELKPWVNAHLNQARELAGDDLVPFFNQRGILDQVYPEFDDLMQTPGFVDPIAAFDNLFFVGQTAVSAWAIRTREGLVVLDALNNAEEAEKILVAGVIRLGFKPTDIKYVVVGHEHRDHFGGAAYLQSTYGTRVIASDVAWTSLAAQTGSPTRDITVRDGQRYRVGGETFQFYVTPGHTQGALSTIFPVYDGRTEHVAAQYGGFGIPRTVELKATQIDSLRRFSRHTRRAEVDVIIGNHQVQDQSLYKFDLLKHRRFDRRGRAIDPNPFVLRRRDAYTRFLAMQEECVRTLAARAGQRLPDEVNVPSGVWAGYRLR